MTGRVWFDDDGGIPEPEPPEPDDITVTWTNPAGTGPWWLPREPGDVPDVADVTFDRAEAAEPVWPIPEDPWAIEGPVGPDPF